MDAAHGEKRETCATGGIREMGERKFGMWNLEWGMGLEQEEVLSSEF